MEKITVSKVRFAEAVRAEGIAINPDYRYVVSDWVWLQPYLENSGPTPNAIDFRDTSFNILFHEKFTNADVKDIVDGILKVESVYSKN